MTVIFHKMHGAGNDFVILDLRWQEMQLDEGTVKRIADRRTGIGCDQVLVLRLPADRACIAAFDIWNADGSRAMQCGNGARCLAAYLHAQGDTPDGAFCLQSPSGNLEIECLDDGQVRVNMGVPRFEPQSVPLHLTPHDGVYEIDIDGHRVELGAVSMGNPHAMLKVDDAQHAQVGVLGPAISTHPVFPDGCNVGFAQVINPAEIRLRVFERGAAETLACGSGACAAAVILRHWGDVESKIRVNQRGGVLIIEWKGNTEPVMMTGPAVYVFEGNLE